MTDFFFSCLATLGVLLRTLPAWERAPWSLAYSKRRLGIGSWGKVAIFKGGAKDGGMDGLIGKMWIETVPFRVLDFYPW